MIAEIFDGNKSLLSCDQSNIPRTNDSIVIHEIKYLVEEVIWDYDIRKIYIQVERLD